MFLVWRVCLIVSRESQSACVRVTHVSMTHSLIHSTPFILKKTKIKLAGAIYGGPGATPKDAALGLFTAEDWNTVASLETLPYYYSKVEREGCVWGGW